MYAEDLVALLDDPAYGGKSGDKASKDQLADTITLLAKKIDQLQGKPPGTP